MEKFGPAVRAGPGVASENVGLDGVGDPSGCCGGGGAAFFSAGFTRPEPGAWLSALPTVFAPERPVFPARVPALPEDGALGFVLPPEPGLGLGLVVGVGL